MTNVLILLLVAAAAYIAHCWWRPFRDCPKCKGSSRNYDGRGWGTFNESCRWCGNSGRRRRWGSRLLGSGFGKL